MQDYSTAEQKATVIDFFAITGSIDKLTIFGINPSEWTPALVTFA